jgi:hypothetical protein
VVAGPAAQHGERGAVCAGRGDRRRGRRPGGHVAVSRSSESRIARRSTIRRSSSTIFSSASSRATSQLSGPPAANPGRVSASRRPNPSSFARMTKRTIARRPACTCDSPLPPGGRRKQPAALVIAQRLNIHSGPAATSPVRMSARKPCTAVPRQGVPEGAALRATTRARSRPAARCRLSRCGRSPSGEPRSARGLAAQRVATRTLCKEALERVARCGKWPTPSRTTRRLRGKSLTSARTAATGRGRGRPP